MPVTPGQSSYKLGGASLLSASTTPDELSYWFDFLKAAPVGRSNWLGGWIGGREETGARREEEGRSRNFCSGF